MDLTPGPDVRARLKLSRWLLWPVAATVAVVVAVSFLLSFQSQAELAVAAQIRPEVAWGLPIVIDGAIVVSTFAALILGPQGFRVAWYPWVTLTLFGAVSIWSNGIHATGAELSTVELFLVGSIPAVGLLLSTHLLAILISHGRGAPASTSSDETLPAVAEPRTVTPERPTKPRTVLTPPTSAAAPEPGALSTQTTPAPAAPPRATKALTRAAVIDRVRANPNTSAADVADWMKLSPLRGQKILDQIRAELEGSTAA